MANVNWWTVGLLVLSNFVMLYAWYGHLRSMSGAPIWKVILVSWLIALVEYCFMIPANRLGARTMTLEQLKIVQEALSLLIFIPFSIFIMNETLKWLKSIGGVDAVHKLDVKKAETLYAEIDRNPLFVGTAAKEDRSIMNVAFVPAPGFENIQDEFLTFAKDRGMVGIKGHRSVGGFRASLYNACTQEDVDALVACMQEFEKLHR